MAKKINYGWYIVAALFATVTMGVLSSCSDDDNSYTDIVDKKSNNDNTPNNNPSNPKDSVVVDPQTWKSKMGTDLKNINWVMHHIIKVECEDNSLTEVKMVYPLDINVSAPIRVIGEKDSTVYYRRTHLEYDEWQNVYEGTDSIQVTRAHYVYYTHEPKSGELFAIKVSFNIQRGYIMIKGKKADFPDLTNITSEYVGETRNWIKDYELNDSTFLREELSSEINLNVLFKDTTLYSTTFIDRNGKPKVANEEPTVTADYYIKGLQGYLGGNKFFNKQTNHWSDGLLYEGSDSYLIVVYNYTVNGDGKESFLSRSAVTVKKSDVGAASYDAVMCDPNSGHILPGFLNVHGTSWTIEGPVNYSDACYESHTKQEANNSGIKNQPEDNNASCSAVVTVNPGESTVNGYKFFTTSVKTSVHQYTVRVADENLRQ